MDKLTSRAGIEGRTLELGDRLVEVEAPVHFTNARVEAWMDWAGRAGQHLTDMGAPLGNGREISPSGTADAAAGVGGYSILEAEDMDQALALMDGHPHLMMPGASIQVYEALDIPGM